MGMFKDIKHLKDQGDAQLEAQGKRTGMIGMLRDMPSTINQASQAVDDAMALQVDLQRQQALLASGTPGRASITNFVATGTLVNFNPQVVLDLEITIAGREPYAARLTTAVPQVYLARLQAGGSIGVKVDPNDPSSMAIDWMAP